MEQNGSGLSYNGYEFVEHLCDDAYDAQRWCGVSRGETCDCGMVLEICVACCAEVLPW